MHAAVSTSTGAKLNACASSGRQLAGAPPLTETRKCLAPLSAWQWKLKGWALEGPACHHSPPVGQPSGTLGLSLFQWAPL